MDVDGLIKRFSAGAKLLTIDESRQVAAALRELKRERDEARAECMEQARLLGAGSEREARLIAKRDEARAERERLTELIGTMMEAMDFATAHVLGQHEYPNIPTDKQVADVLTSAMDLGDAIITALEGK